jgi:opacity protein-like surface antigen
MANVGFGQTTLTDSDIRINSFNWQIGVGYSFFLAPNVALEPGLYYQYTRDTNTAVNSSKTIGRIINLGLGLKIFL